MSDHEYDPAPRMARIDCCITVIVALVLWLVSCVARGAESRDYLVLNLASYHFDREKEYNELNTGLGLERRVGESRSWHAGFYRNSFERDSLYVFGSYTPVLFRARDVGWLRLPRVRIGGAFGGVTGYESGVTPALTGLMSFEGRNYGADVVITPVAIGFRLKASF